MTDSNGKIAIDPDAKPVDGFKTMARLLVATAEREEKAQDHAVEAQGG